MGESRAIREDKGGAGANKETPLVSVSQWEGRDYPCLGDNDKHWVIKHGKQLQPDWTRHGPFNNHIFPATDSSVPA